MKSLLPVSVLVIAVSGLALTSNAISATTSSLPPEHTQGNITYLIGGVAESESNAIRHVARRYPLELEFLLKAKPKDEYLSNVQVKLTDEHAVTVLNVKAEGPYLLAKLPAGKYAIEAEHDGKTEHRNVEIVPKGHRRVVFEWKS